MPSGACSAAERRRPWLRGLPGPGERPREAEGTSGAVGEGKVLPEAERWRQEGLGGAGRGLAASGMATQMFEGRGHAAVYQKYRFSPGEELQGAILGYLREKVSRARPKCGVSGVFLSFGGVLRCVGLWRGVCEAWVPP